MQALQHLLRDFGGDFCGSAHKGALGNRFLERFLCEFFCAFGCAFFQQGGDFFTHDGANNLAAKRDEARCYIERALCKRGRNGLAQINLLPFFCLTLDVAAKLRQK